MGRSCGSTPPRRASRKGVLDVITGADIVAAGWKTPPVLSFFKGVGGSSVRIPFRPGLAHGRVRFVGEPVAVVIAETEHLAQDAAEKIEIEYEDLPVVVDASEALKASAPRVHDEMPDNLCFEYEYGNSAGAEQSVRQGGACHPRRRHRAAHRRQPDGAEVLPGALRRRDGHVRSVLPDPGHLGHQGRACFDHRPRRNQVPRPLQRRRRRLRRAQRNLSGIPGGAVRRQAHRQAGALDRHALGDDLWRSSCARRRPEGRAGDRRQGQVPRPARRMAGQHGRLLLGRRGADQHRRGADQLGDQPLQGAGVLRPAPPRLHPHDADYRLSRRGPPQRRLSLGAPRRGSGGDARRRSGEAAPAQHSREGRVPDEDADRPHL